MVRTYLNKILPVELFLCEPEVKSVEGAWDLTDLLHLDVVLRDPVKYLCSDGDLRNKVEKMRKRCLKTSTPIGAWKYKFPPFQAFMADRQTSRPTDGHGGS